MKQKFLFGAENTAVLRRFLDSSENLDIAVAFWGEGVFSTLEANLKRYPHRRLRIICNLESGAVNPEFARFCVSSEQIQIKTSPILHSKVISSKSEYIVGSTNISSNGLGHEGDEAKGWMESSIAGSDVSILKDIQKWFSQEWETAVPISHDDITKSEFLWKKRRNQRAIAKTSQKNGSLLNAVLSDPISFKDKEIYLAIYRENLSKEGRKKEHETKKNLGVKDLTSYENWEMPRDAYIVEVYFEPSGRVEIQNRVYISLDPYSAQVKYANGKTGKLVFGKIVPKIEGHRKICSDLRAFKKIVPKIWESIKDNGDDYGRLIPIDQISNFFNKTSF